MQYYKKNNEENYNVRPETENYLVRPEIKNYPIRPPIPPPPPIPRLEKVSLGSIFLDLLKTNQTFACVFFLTCLIGTLILFDELINFTAAALM